MYSDTLMPYQLASMHPILHLGLLLTSSSLQYIDSEKFFNVPNGATCKNPTALKFIDTNKYDLVQLT